MLKLAFLITTAVDRWLASYEEQRDAFKYCHLAVSLYGDVGIDYLLRELRGAPTRQAKRALRIAVAHLIKRKHIMIPLGSGAGIVAR